MTATTSTRVHSADISIQKFGKRYGDDPTAMPAVDNVSLEISSGEFVAVVGASGCGKSTLIRVLAGFEEATEGTVTVAGSSVDGPGPDRAMVFQDYGLFPWLSVRENVAYGPRQRGFSRTEAKAQAERFIEIVGLSRFATNYPGELSGGMQQRVAIARVLANEPSVMLMDEPFGALDALTRSSMQTELARIHQATGTTVLFVTHSIEEALYLADRVVVMFGGPSHGVPGSIKEVISVDLPAPRDVTSARFNDLERHISDLIHEGGNNAH